MEIMSSQIWKNEPKKMGVMVRADIKEYKKFL